jgi:hypothetical protein
LDFDRARVVEDAAQLETQVLEITAGSRMFTEFLNDGLEVGQGTDSRQWWNVSRPHSTTEAGQQESGLDHFQGNAAVKPDASLALVWNTSAQRRIRQVYVESQHSGDIRRGRGIGVWL